MTISQSRPDYRALPENPRDWRETMFSGGREFFIAVCAGLKEMVNLAITCRPCNSSKNAKTPEEWEAVRR